MKRTHVHVWRIDAPHPFGAVRRYRCTSCPTTRTEKRETEAEFVARVERDLGSIPATATQAGVAPGVRAPTPETKEQL